MNLYGKLKVALGVAIAALVAFFGMKKKAEGKAEVKAEINKKVVDDVKKANKARNSVNQPDKRNKLLDEFTKK